MKIYSINFKKQIKDLDFQTIQSDSSKIKTFSEKELFLFIKKKAVDLLRKAISARLPKEVR